MIIWAPAGRLKLLIPPTNPIASAQTPTEMSRFIASSILVGNDLR
jgi:hypothetical protein